MKRTTTRNAFVSRGELFSFGFKEEVETEVNDNHEVRQVVRYRLNIACNTCLVYQPAEKNYEWYLITKLGDEYNHCSLYIGGFEMLDKFIKVFKFADFQNNNGDAGGLK